jgi:hypothetical protein
MASRWLLLSCVFSNNSFPCVWCAAGLRSGDAMELGRGRDGVRQVQYAVFMYLVSAAVPS